MHELIPYTPRRSPLKTDLFLFSTTHGQAHIGFSLNDYCYISPESFEQDLVAGSPAEWEYMYELFRDAKGVWEGERNTFRALEHLLGFRIVLASSWRPLAKVPHLAEKVKVDSTPKWYYTSSISFDRYPTMEDIEDDFRYGGLSFRSYMSYILSRAKDNMKKRFFAGNMDANGSLELLISHIAPDAKIMPTLDISSHYGMMVPYRGRIIPATHHKKKRKKVTHILR